MKRFVLSVAFILSLSALSFAQDRLGNFTIRIEPTARLQTGAPIPFHIRINDDRGKPFPDAKVTLTIESSDHQTVKIFKAPPIDEGVYVAKPVFNSAGDWAVRVDVRRDHLIGSKSDEYTVPRSTEP